MNVFPIFIVGFCVGAVAISTYDSYKSNKPDTEDILKNIISSLQTEIDFLEKENKELKNKLNEK